MKREIIVRNYVNRFVKGASMMFAHGYGCDQNMWRFITPVFQEDYEIVLFDHVGLGNSVEYA
ncbi:alpha/beta hydrolase [Marivirga sp.]|uniref:alpha/beta fold hydrolase n=1 Tax=Marivirga sp. TaxID=2018662 RepID=UPI002D7FA9C2|nr:alpha/beta hydrolase [Marivirga sp.]HET8859024.1 alpha/beta hydrolase [Marivirga sp.]